MDISAFQTELAGLGAKITPDGVAVFANNAAVSFRFPSGAEANDPAVSQAARVVRAVAQMHGAIKAIEEDSRFSAEHKARLVAEARESHGKAVALELAAADAIVGRFDKADAAEAVPPQLAATDALNIALDREVRDWTRDLDLAGQTQLARELLDGSQPRVLLALLRSPIKVGGVLGETMASAWADAVARADPKSAKLRALAKATNDALRMTAQQAAAAMPATRPTLRVA